MPVYQRMWICGALFIALGLFLVSNEIQFRMQSVVADATIQMGGSAPPVRPGFVSIVFLNEQGVPQTIDFSPPVGFVPADQMKIKIRYIPSALSYCRLASEGINSGVVVVLIVGIAFVVGGFLIKKRAASQADA